MQQAQDHDPLSDRPALIKEKLSRRYLGVGGIHGIGLVRGGKVLRVHCSPGGERSDILEQLKREAAPLPVEIVPSLPPRIR
jgi:hypothetical protein